MLSEYEAVMKAAGDRTRARILKILQHGELCVCQVMAVLGMSSSTISKHLSILKMTGLTCDRREGRWVYYSLETRGRNKYATAVLQQLQEWLEDDSQVLADREKLRVICATPVDELCSRIDGPGSSHDPGNTCDSDSCSSSFE